MLQFSDGLNLAWCAYEGEFGDFAFGCVVEGEKVRRVRVSCASGLNDFPCCGGQLWDG